MFQRNKRSKIPFARGGPAANHPPCALLLHAWLPTRLAPIPQGTTGPFCPQNVGGCTPGPPGTPQRDKGMLWVSAALPRLLPQPRIPGSSSPPATINTQTLKNRLSSLLAGSGNIVPAGKRASFSFLQSVCSFAVCLLHGKATQLPPSHTAPHEASAPRAPP